jgi:hypothetical protein
MSPENRDVWVGVAISILIRAHRFVRGRRGPLGPSARNGARVKQLLNWFSAPHSTGRVIACVAGDPMEAGKRLLADDPLWHRGKFEGQSNYDPSHSRLRVSGRIHFRCTND